MRNFINIVLYLALGFFFPLLGKPGLLLDFQIIILMVVTIIMILSQPTFSTEDGNDHHHWAYWENGYTSITNKAIGFVLMSLGLIFRIWSIKTLGRYFTASVKLVNGHQIINSGPYSVLRHPSYSGAWLTFIGVAVFLGYWIGVVGAIVLMGYAYSKRIAAEEKTLLDHFGDKYSVYKSETSGIVPWLW
ncbi:MAG: isoprenylcysteine carboxylmethyltransferase family protein [Saprospiraceae bacterium]